MQCYSCGGEMERINKDIEANWKGRQMVFRGLHAWVCRSCGEQVYEPEDVRLMQNLMRSVEADDDYPEIMNVQEVAGLLRVSNQTVYNLARSGQLPAVKVGREWRFRRDEVLAALSSGDQGEAACSEESIHLVARGQIKDGLSAEDEQVIKKHIEMLKDE